MISQIFFHIVLQNDNISNVFEITEKGLMTLCIVFRQFVFVVYLNWQIFQLTVILKSKLLLIVYV